MAAVDLLVEFLFPRRCVVCGQGGIDLCEKCWLSLGGRLRLEGRKAGLEGLFSVYDYKNVKVSQVIEAIKFGFNRRLVVMLLPKMSKLRKELRNIDVVVPVPLFRRRLNWRGFNQAEEIARQVAKQSGLEMRNCLVRVRDTAQQAMTKGREERKQNMKAAFAVEKKEPGELRGKRVLLVDDVFTSGATMRESARVLREAGVESVWGFVLAR